MRMRTFLGQLTVLVMGTLLGLTSQAEAGNRAGAVTLSPMVGAHIFGPNDAFQNTAFGGLKLGYNFSKNWGVELGGTTSNVENKGTGAADFNYSTAQLDLLYHFRPDENLVPYFAAGVGRAFQEDSTSVPAANEDPLFNYGVGLKYFFTDWLALRLDARQEITLKSTTGEANSNNHILSGGLSFQIGGTGPEVMLQKEPAIEKVAVARDSDADGVIDPLDLCAGTPVGVSVDLNGCEPIVEELAPPVIEPVVVADADADGIADGVDQCPNSPAEFPVNDQGCPADRDQDGVFDMDDNCPDTEFGKEVAVDGCEIIYPVVDELNLEINFASNDSRIDPQYSVQLQKAADFIKSHPDKSYVIEGYTDSSGSAVKNRQLSQKRADTVRWYLVRDFGVNRFKLTAKGFGSENPIADNSTRVGRMINRRVMIRTVD